MRDKQETVRANRTAGLWRPYRVPCYGNYAEAMKGLYREGTPYAFYKGNTVRALHILLFHKLNTELTFRMESTIPVYWRMVKEIPFAQEFFLSCAVDMML